MSRFLSISVGLIVFVIVLLMNESITKANYDVAWARQFGSSEKETVQSVAVGGLGNIFVTGSTYGDFGDDPAGRSDIFLTKYDSAGNLVWVRQQGSSTYDSSSEVAVDSMGNAYVTGSTSGDIGGGHYGNRDAFLMKYDPAGNLLWTEQFGSPDLEKSFSVAVDGNDDIYIVGEQAGTGGTAETYNVFLAKYDSYGSRLWKKTLGTGDYDISRSVAVDAAGNAYIGGLTCGTLGSSKGADSSDAFFAKYDPSGNLLWVEQIVAEGHNHAQDISVDGFGNVYVASSDYGDYFVSKYTSSGGLVWDKFFATSVDDSYITVTVDIEGNIYTSGSGQPFDDIYDEYLAKYDTDGNLLWAEHLFDDETYGSPIVALDHSGNAYLGSHTSIDFSGVSAGNRDGYLVKLVEEGICTMVSRGDFNCDGEVGLLDLDILGRNWGADWLIGYEGDSDGDGVVGLLDLNVLGDNWRTTATPEPGVIGLVVVGGLVFVRRR